MVCPQGNCNLPSFDIASISRKKRRGKLFTFECCTVEIPVHNVTGLCGVTDSQTTPQLQEGRKNNFSIHLAIVTDHRGATTGRDHICDNGMFFTIKRFACFLYKTLEPLQDLQTSIFSE